MCSFLAFVERVSLSAEEFFYCARMSVSCCAVWSTGRRIMSSFFRVGLTGAPVDKGYRCRFFAREVFIGPGSDA